MIKTHVLQNGLRIMMERLPYLRSAAVGIFVRAGSILETKEESGLSHFLEHMAFKGTTSKTAKDIAEQIDLIGGNVNAATSKMATSFFARTTDLDLRKALLLLADLVVRPQVAQNDFEKERQVILEEIAMEADSPEDTVYNLLHMGLYGEQSLSRTILGGKEAISSYSLQQLLNYRQKVYQPGNAVLSVTGRFDPEELIAWAEEAFADWQGLDQVPVPLNQPISGPAMFLKDKDAEQVHLCINYEGLPSQHKDRYALMALTTALGGGVSSRLFQKVREQEGLVYTIYATPSFYPDCGEFTIYAACSPKKVNRVLALVDQEVKALVQDGLEATEFAQTAAQMRTGFVLGMESAYQRMASMGMQQLLYDKIFDPKETLSLMRKVKPRDVSRLAKTLLSKEPVLSLVGKKVEKQFGNTERDK